MYFFAITYFRVCFNGVISCMDMLFNIQTEQYDRHALAQKYLCNYYALVLNYSEYIYINFVCDELTK